MRYPWIVLLGVMALGLLYVLVPIAADAFSRYRRKRTVHCPETGTEAEVRIDAAHAALSAITGPTEVRVKDCSLWPERSGCERACSSQL